MRVRLSSSSASIDDHAHCVRPPRPRGPEDYEHEWVPDYLEC